MQSNNLFILETEDQGRGIYAGVDFNPGDVIEICPVIIIPEWERKELNKMSLHDYYFVWGKEENKAAIALGYGSLYNHSSFPNAQFVNDLISKSIIIECIKKIGIGEQICLNYIDDGKKEKLWFDEK